MLFYPRGETQFLKSSTVGDPYARYCYWNALSVEARLSSSAAALSTQPRFSVISATDTDGFDFVFVLGVFAGRWVLFEHAGDAPVYFISGELSDLEDMYEPQFFYPEEAWLEQNYAVNLTVTDPDVTEIFYFCHIHNGMSGR